MLAYIHIAQIGPHSASQPLYRLPAVIYDAPGLSHPPAPPLMPIGLSSPFSPAPTQSARQGWGVGRRGVRTLLCAGWWLLTAHWQRVGRPWTAWAGGRAQGVAGLG